MESHTISVEIYEADMSGQIHSFEEISKHICPAHPVHAPALRCTHKNAQLLHKPTNVHMHVTCMLCVCMQHTNNTEAAVNGAMVFGSSWNCKWMLLRFQLIVLRNFGHGSLFMVTTAGEV